MMLYPMTNPFRTAIRLDGVWNFSTVSEDYVPIEPLKTHRKVAVPSSYNELFADKAIRDHVGMVCYETTFTVPKTLEKREIRLRVGAAGNRATVFLDGVMQGSHEGAFLPFDLLIPTMFCVREEVRLSILIDNRLDFRSLPIGEVKVENGKAVQTIFHDFANHSGITRSVWLYARPSIAIQDVWIQTKGHGKTAKVDYRVETRSSQVQISILSPSGELVAETMGASGSIRVENPILWDIGKGNLYTLVVKTPHDMVKERFGIRDFEVKKDRILLNGKPVFLKGFGMHEDHVTIGKGYSPAMAIRDFELLKWINANSFRTSHYPYAEEILTLADESGILVIDEVPAVGLNFWSPRPVFVKGTVDEETQSVHKNQLTELIRRDKNHPCVVMVSLANEANTQEEGARAYFEPLFAHARSLTDKPLTIVDWVGAKENKVADLADVLCVNRYIGWYVDTGDLSTVEAKITADLTAYHQKYQKPVVLSEFGADTIAGFHSLPSTIFSEEYQVEFLETYLRVLKKLPFVVGAHVWNFADFLTKEGLTRVGGNKKGVFTRDRQPKAAAHFLKKAWSEEQR
jgi:beta-glucuronidase